MSLKEPIHLTTIPDSIPPNEKLVEGLRGLLKEAEEGKLRSFVGAGNYNTGDIYRMGLIDQKMKVGFFGIMGALHSLANCIHAEYFSDDFTTR
jgi:hypothetical protein